jgi:hypothetical protein
MSGSASASTEALRASSTSFRNSSLLIGSCGVEQRPSWCRNRQSFDHSSVTLHCHQEGGIRKGVATGRHGVLVGAEADLRRSRCIARIAEPGWRNSGRGASSLRSWSPSPYRPGPLRRGHGGLRARGLDPGRRRAGRGPRGVFWHQPLRGIADLIAPSATSTRWSASGNGQDRAGRSTLISGGPTDGVLSMVSLSRELAKWGRLQAP